MRLLILAAGQLLVLAERLTSPGGWTDNHPGGGATTDPGGGATGPGGAGNHPGGGATDPDGGATTGPGGGATSPGGGATTGPSGGATSPGGGATTGPSGGATSPGGGATDPGSSAGNHPGGWVTSPGGGATDPGSSAGNHPGGWVTGPVGGAADQQNEALKQGIVNYLIGFITPGIKTKINTHTNTTWNEGKQDYNISGANQFFGAIQYTDAQKQPKLYNTQDDESKTARREMYLGFGYSPPHIEAFGKLANKMVAAQNVQMKTDLENMVDKIRKYSKAYYLTTYNTLNDKQDKLMKLALSDLQILKERFSEIDSSNSDINSKFVYSIAKDCHEDIKIGTAKHQLKTTATAEEIQDYLKDKFDSAESDFDNAINTANEIAGILNKIQ
ncbi:hypothetical protein K9R62_04460 (plasmid) [Borrelia hermsii]|uniref:virulence associated lipoprotein n=1 Tax=Borrelia hermsii TaxID=140 RepID=UPI001CF5F9BE|nr:virulence associated lipoprotein [Borrelia hermsii]UCP02037.1 hypothetical protein K9R62_04460 [Borrelia hermsii]